MNPHTHTKGQLGQMEAHPAAASAMRYLKSIPPMRWAELLEVFASTALSGNRLGDICSETMNRIMRGHPVSDRYVLGLAWTISELERERPTV